MTEIEKYARAAASTARTPSNSPARRAAIDAENSARVAAEQFAANRERRIADLEAKCDTLKRLHDAATAERDELAHGHRSQHNADSAELRRVCAARDAARKERDELRAQIDACKPHLRERLDGTLESPAGMLALRETEVLRLLERLSAAQMQGGKLRARLEEIEGREPVAWQCRFSSDGDDGWSPCSREHCAMVSEETSGGFARDGYEVRELIPAAPGAAR